MHGTQITYAVLPGALTVCEQKCVCVWVCQRERYKRKSLVFTRMRTQDVLIMKLVLLFFPIVCLSLIHFVYIGV